MISIEGSRVQVSGSLTMDTVRAAFDAGVGNSEAQAEILVDMSAVEDVDSSAVSLLLAWVREAQRTGVKLQFMAAPENLLSLAKMYGVDGMIPFHSESVVQN